MFLDSRLQLITSQCRKPHNKYTSKICNCTTGNFVDSFRRVRTAAEKALQRCFGARSETCPNREVRRHSQRSLRHSAQSEDHRGRVVGHLLQQLQLQLRR